MVYKVDRLTRSLADFAKLVELFDAHGVSFVSVTQSFNTTTSMGRLTLNVLLSFAQFEREVTGERIRDKIAASKKKGLWMGGVLPLGYTVVDRKLVVVPEEAETVRLCFERYRDLRSLPALQRDLRERWVVTRVRTLATGRTIGGIPHGDPHVVSSAPGMRAVPNLEIHRRPEDGNVLPFAIQTGGDGPGDAHLICGFFSCDARPFNPLLDALPRFMRFSRDTSPSEHSLLDQFIRFVTAETENKRVGSQSVLNRLSELMFVEVIRMHMDQLANNNIGWLAGLRDPLVGRVLTLLHAQPTHDWTLEELASEAAASRSALADRFTQIVGCPPIQYLTQWRMQIAAKRLADPNVKIAAVAHEVGYESEAAFSRAFKKFVGRSPSQWRNGAN